MNLDEKKEPTKKYTLVLVEWIDAQSDSEWETPDKLDKWIEEDCLINEIGWLIKENRRYIIVSNQISYDGDIGCKTKIPKTWIKKRENIKVVKLGQRDKKKKNKKKKKMP